MGQRIIDDNVVVDFVDDNGVTWFVDEDSNFTVDRPLRPFTDVTDGGWTDQSGGTSLADAIGEDPVDDANYIKSSSSPSNDACEIALSDPPGALRSPVKVQSRFRKEGTAAINLTVRLMQGATQIATWTYTGISASFIDQEETLTAPQVAAITNANDLRLVFEATV